MVENCHKTNGTYYYLIFLKKNKAQKINDLHIWKHFFLYLFSAQSFQQYLGTYDRQEAKNYLEFLDDLGLNKLLKKAATASNPVLEVNYDEETKIWSFKTCTKITCNNLNFKIGDEYNRKTKDGREVIIKAIQKGNAKTFSI